MGTKATQTKRSYDSTSSKVAVKRSSKNPPISEDEVNSEISYETQRCPNKFLVAFHSHLTMLTGMQNSHCTAAFTGTSVK